MSQRAQVTEDGIRALEPSATPYKRAESSARGEGRLMIRVLPSGRKDFYYRYRFKRRDYTKKLGRFQQRPADGGLTLREERRKAAELIRLRIEHPELKSCLRQQEAAKKAAERQADLASRRGSFAQLLAAYVDRLRHRGAVSSRSVEALCARAE